MYTNNRDAYRQTFFNAWQKYQKKLLLEPVETQIIEIILQHPEYHALLDKPNAFQSQEFALEENPFFHMSLHMALREQLRMQRPTGINDIYQKLLIQHESQKEVEHLMMTCLAETIWETQQTGQPPSEEDYLQKLNQL